MLGKIYALAQVYSIGHNIVAGILDEPSLLPATIGAQSGGLRWPSAQRSGDGGTV